MAEKTLRCPICRQPVAFDGPQMPFCSERCRSIDLGNWATEKYKIPAAGDAREFEKDFDEENRKGPAGSE